MSQWIYNEPPPPPAPSSSTDGLQSFDGQVNGRGRGRGRGQKRNFRGQIRQQFQPAMSFDQAPSYLQRPENDSHQSAGRHLPEPPPWQHVQPSRGVVSYDAPPSQAASTVPVQYNEAGYALSATYNPIQQPPSTRPAMPAPPIQGTNISLDTPEDIAAWIQERKRKWPTDANVQKNKLEKAQSGLLNTNKKQKRKGGQAKRQSDRPVQENQRAVPVPIRTPENVATSSLPPSSLDVALAAVTNSIEAAAAVADDPEAPQPESVPGPTLAPEPAASSDISSVSSSSESSSDTDSSDSSDNDDDILPEAISSKLATLPPTEEVTPITVTAQTKGKRPCKYFRQGRCKRGDECIFSHVLPAQAAQGIRMQKPVQPQRVDDRYKWRKRKSLYERLVEAEVQKEQEEAQKAQEVDPKDDQG